MLRSKFGIDFRPCEDYAPTAELLTGKEAGAQVERLAPTQRGILRLGTVTPYKYQCLVVQNPALIGSAHVSSPLLFEPNEVGEVNLVISAIKEVVLSDYEYFVRLYLFE